MIELKKTRAKTQDTTYKLVNAKATEIKKANHRPKEYGQRKPIHVQLDIELYEKLHDLAEVSHGGNMTKLVNDILSEYASKN